MLTSQATTIDGAYIIHSEKSEDERGSFARAWCRQTFETLGLETGLEQISVSASTEPHTLRGMHMQRIPHAETKLVRCIRGAVFDAIIDMRADSPTYLQTFSTVLDAETGSALYVPAGCAHGFLTLERDSALLYQMTKPYVADAATGFAWNDPAFAIRWPHTPRVLSPRDLSWPLIESANTPMKAAA